MARRSASQPARGLGADAAPSPGARLPCHDPTELGKLLRALEPRMTAVALRLTRDRETALDVVQSAFEKVCRHCTQFRGQSRASTWVHRIVANEALMWLRTEQRRAQRTVDLDGDPEPALRDPAPSPAEMLSTRQQLEQLRRGVAALRPEEREVIQHCALGGQSYLEYGRKTGSHPAAVKSRAFRARRRLGRRLRPS